MSSVQEKKYFYNDIPPLPLTLSVTVQSALIALINFTFLLVIFRYAHLSQTLTVEHLQWLVVAYFIGVFIQCFHYSPGCGYFMPATSPAVYLGPAILAIDIGGLPLMIGMMIFAGLCEFLLSFVLDKIRLLFPKEIAGLALLAIGAQVAMVGFKYAIAIHPHFSAILVTMITLLVISIFSIWGNGVLRNLAILFGVVSGATYLHFFSAADLHIANSANFIQQLSWAGLPSWHVIWPLHISFNFALAPLFLFAGFAATIRTIGVLLIAKYYEDQVWQRPNFKLIKKAVRGDGLTCMISGFLSGLGLNVAPVTATLAINAKCTSKLISYGIAIIYLGLAFSPKLIGYFCLMPSILIGSIMIYYSALLLISGLKILDPSKFETREMFSIGLSIVVIISIIGFPKTYHLLPADLYALIANPLSAALFIAISLTIFFHIKRRKFIRFSINEVDKASDLIKVNSNSFGETWNVSRDYVNYASKIANEVVLQIYQQSLSEDEVNIEFSYDKFNLDVIITYQGRALEIPSLSAEKVYTLLEDEAVSYGLIQYFKGVYPDKIHISTDNGQSTIRLRCFIQ